MRFNAGRTIKLNYLKVLISEKISGSTGMDCKNISPYRLVTSRLSKLKNMPESLVVLISLPNP